MSSIIKVDTVQDQDGNNIINENANTITIGASGDTITIPSGATLANNGTATGFASIAWQSVVTASTLTAEAGKGYWIDTTSNVCTVTLPSSASVGDQIILVDYDRTWGTNNLTIDQNGLNYQGGTENPVYDTNGQTVNIVYSGATQGWIPTSDDDVADEGNPPPYDIDFLAVAGGGSGGSDDGGGGGGGGMRTSTQSANIGTVITVTVGDGGSGATRGIGITGSNSSISGSGLITITSAGGGGGGTDFPSALAGLNGGSGGGGNYGGTAKGLGDTPSTSPSQGNNGGQASTGSPYYGSSGGGGGGASGSVGVNGTNSGGGNGGAGTASSITGSSVTYAGGGGGGTGGGGTPTGTGGAGGGGNGGGTSGQTSGTVNLGGGGGGSGFTNPNKGAGGKGVVILSMLLANFSGTTTGSPTEADDGTTKILTFNGSGSYTA